MDFFGVFFQRHAQRNDQGLHQTYPSGRLSVVEGKRTTATTTTTPDIVRRSVSTINSPGPKVSQTHGCGRRAGLVCVDHLTG